MLKVMSIIAHQDDFEFGAGGLFAALNQAYGNNIKLKVLTTTRGASGHHEMNLEETFRRRELEAKNSASIINAEYECLTCLDGSHLPGQVFIDKNVLGGLWNAIRNFEPDYIFCPPVTTDPFAGIHIDHYNTAWAVRMVAYQLSVPHAYPTMNETPKMRTTYPVIINIDDTYACENAYDFAIDISSVYNQKLKMALCHESQVLEWLPWNSSTDNTASKITQEDYKQAFKIRHSKINHRYGKQDNTPREYYHITGWGKKVSLETIKQDLFSSLSEIIVN